MQGSAVGKQSQMDALQKTAAEKASELQQAQQAMETAQKAATETANALTAAQQAEQKWMPLVKPAEEKAAASKQAFDKVSAELSSAQQLVSRWTDEIAFSKQFAELTAQRVRADAIAIRTREQAGRSGCHRRSSRCRACQGKFRPGRSRDRFRRKESRLPGGRRRNRKSETGAGNRHANEDAIGRGRDESTATACQAE